MGDFTELRRWGKKNTCDIHVLCFLISSWGAEGRLVSVFTQITVRAATMAIGRTTPFRSSNPSIQGGILKN